MRLALTFLTRLPVGSPAVQDYASALGRQAPLFPVVGLIVGLFALAADGAAGLFFGEPVRAVAAIAASIGVTGALHLDGLLDTADGLLSSRPRERMLEIMRDSRVGAMGVVIGALALLVRFALLTGTVPAVRWRALLLAPALGRTSLVMAAGLWPCARGTGQGMGGSFAAAVGRWQVAGALAVGLGLSLALGGGWRGPVAWVLGLAMTALAARMVTARLGGLTGDTYGAINEAVEAAVLALFAAVWKGGGWPW